MIIHKTDNLIVLHHSQEVDGTISSLVQSTTSRMLSVNGRNLVIYSLTNELNK